MDEELIRQVWEKGKKIEGYNSDQFRKDPCGAWILFNRYGDRSSIYGWEIDHAYPEKKGGDDNIENLRPMQWENNLSKGDNYPEYKAQVQAVNNENEHMETKFTISSSLQAILRQIYKIDQY